MKKFTFGNSEFRLEVEVDNSKIKITATDPYCKRYYNATLEKADLLSEKELEEFALNYIHTNKYDNIDEWSLD